MKLIIENKWIEAVFAVVLDQLTQLIHVLTKRLTELEGRYKTSLPTIELKREELRKIVQDHLQAMGLKWE